MLDVRLQWEARQGFRSRRGTHARRIEASRVAAAERRRVVRTAPAVEDLLTRAADAGLEVTEAEAQAEVLAALQSPRSLWPVDTGFSLVGWQFRNVPAPRGARAWVLDNRARYAVFVERRTGAVRRTLDALQSTILQGVDVQLTRRLRRG